MTVAPPRPRAQRIADTRARLEHDIDCWVASADEAGNAHLVPFSYAWLDETVVLAMPPANKSAVNLLRAGVARLALDGTRDVVLVEGTVAEGVDDATQDAYVRHAGWDPRTESTQYIWLRVTPLHIQAWREANELRGRTLMKEGAWLEGRAE
jgi:hypothetical protein